MDDPVGDTYMGASVGRLNDDVCLKWADISLENFHLTLLDFPDGRLEDAENFCRNPTRDTDGPWCFVNMTGKLSKKTCLLEFCGKLIR